VTTFGRQVLSVEPGDTTSMRFGLAVDIGTTSVVTTLIDLESGEQLASVSSLNPQAAFGGDLMSRIAFAQHNPANLRKLHTRIVGLLNQHVEEILRQSGVLARHVYKVVVVGNTCMHHILLGIDPSYVGLSPYAPVMRHPVVLPARELFLKVNPEARVCLLPIVAGFVGADTMGVALATRLYESSEIRIAVDIGTNGEVLLGSKSHLWACSAPAGPALEGAQLKHGMRGALGAIDRVTITDDVEVHTIGEAPAIGICGSGTIDALAAMLDASIIDHSGLIQVDKRDQLPPRLRERVVRRDEGRQFVLVRPGEAGATGEIVLTQGDIRVSPVISRRFSSPAAWARASPSCSHSESRSLPERWTIGAFPEASARCRARRTGSWSSSDLTRSVTASPWIRGSPFTCSLSSTNGAIATSKWSDAAGVTHSTENANPPSAS
jgi:uncharacterized 2Fe-2S/4Fe-4S cluster protein (DUF4445 family)